MIKVNVPWNMRWMYRVTTLTLNMNYVCHLMRRGIRFRNHIERVLKYRTLVVNYLLLNTNINRRISFFHETILILMIHLR